MDPFNAAVLSAATFVGGIVVKWAVEKFLRRHDENEKKMADAQARADHLERTGELQRVESKIDSMLVEVRGMRSTFEATTTELRERINGISKDHGARIRSLEDFRVEIRTRFELKEEEKNNGSRE